jgi:hypothetical protein
LSSRNSLTGPSSVSGPIIGNVQTLRTASKLIKHASPELNHVRECPRPPGETAIRAHNPAARRLKQWEGFTAIQRIRGTKKMLMPKSFPDADRAGAPERSRRRPAGERRRRYGTPRRLESVGDQIIRQEDEREEMGVQILRPDVSRRAQRHSGPPRVVWDR